MKTTDDKDQRITIRITSAQLRKVNKQVKQFKHRSIGALIRDLIDGYES